VVAGDPRRVRRAFARAALALAAAASAGGCTFMAASGGGPLAREDVGSWLGIGRVAAGGAEELGKAASRLKLCRYQPLVGEYSWREGPWTSRLWRFGGPLAAPFTPALGYHVRGRFRPILRLLPGVRDGNWFYHSASRPGSREFHAAERGWGAGLFVGEWLFSGSRAEAREAATGKRVAAEAAETVFSPLVYCRVRRVVPVGIDGEPGLHGLAHPRLELTDVRYDVREGTALLGGLVAWGRVNSQLYVQLLWIPIDMGFATPEVETTAEPAQ